MADPYLIFGELKPDGSITRDVRVCAVTGRKIVAGDAMIPVPNSNRFYRLKAVVAWNLTPERQAAIEAQLPATTSPTSKVAKTSKETTE